MIKSNVLKKDNSKVFDVQGEHARIVADFEKVCTTAGIQAKYMYESMKVHCSDEEVDWVKNFRKYKAQGIPGLLLDGVAKPDARCQAICAALIRNYIDARVMPLNTVLDLLEEREMPSPHALLIPNLYVQTSGKNLPGWKAQKVYDLMLQRSIASKPSVVYVQSMEGMAHQYGDAFASFLGDFKHITI